MPEKEEGSTRLGAFLTARSPSFVIRLIAASYFAFTTFGFFQWFSATGKWTALLWVLSEGLMALLMVIRRDSDRVSQRLGDWVASVLPTFLVLLVRPTGTATGLLEDVGAGFQIVGVVLTIYAKLVLGRSFGIVPADRGVVTSGPFRLVRHPIYLGYLGTHVGFLLANFSVRNVGIYVVVYACQAIRMFAEERILLRNPTYEEYSRRVRYRLVPGIF